MAEVLDPVADIESVNEHHGVAVPVTIRTITLGMPFVFDNPQITTEKANQFFEQVERKLKAKHLAARTFRVTSQPLDEMIFTQWPDKDHIVQFAADVEQQLEHAWFCLAGPQFSTPKMNLERLDYIAPVLEATEHVFTNTLISYAKGLHIAALRQVANVVCDLTQICERNQANFRFAAMSNIKPNTPYFPASYHAGKPGFSISLELAGIAQRVFSQSLLMDHALMEFRREIEAVATPVIAMAEELATEQGLEFKGIDFSLAPFPGEHTSVMAALEALTHARGGQFEILFGLYSVNQILKSVLPQCPRVGFNGSMFSVLEDNTLAHRVGEGNVSIKDLLSYATVCGCGLDMVPIDIDSRPEKVAAMIMTVATIAMKWNKPLITRLVPSTTCEQGLTKLEHDFLVNTKPIVLDPDEFAMGGNLMRQTYYHNIQVPV